MSRWTAAAARLRAIVPFVRKLSATEVDRYDVISRDLARRVWLIRVPILPGGYAGMTIGRVVFLARRTAPETPSTLLAHELVHVRQFSELGILRFAWRYNLAFAQGLWRLRSWNGAYRAIPAEVEARQQAGAWAIRAFRDTERASDRGVPLRSDDLS